MKKSIKIFLGAVAVVLVLSVSVVYALSGSENASVSDNAQQVQDIVLVCDKTVPLTESAQVLSDSSDHGFSVAELAPESVQSNDSSMIDRDSAIAIAIKHLEAMTDSAPSSVNAVLAEFTDNETSAATESGKALCDLPAWVVTFSDVTLAAQGSGGTVLADSTMVVDAYTGELLEVISYGV